MNNSFFRTHKVLALLPLLLMGAGVWYFIRVRAPGAGQEAPAVETARIFAQKPAAQAAAPAAPAVPEPLSSGEAAARLPEAYDPKAGLDIQGSRSFNSQVTSALKLIWMSDRETFLYIRKNLSIVRNETQTGFYLENGRPVAALSSAHAFRSLTWCAGVIAHQAWHASYTANKKKRRSKKYTPPPPGESSELQVEANPARLDYAGMDAILYIEDKAAAFQLEVLRKVGAPASETGPLFRRAPRDFHLSHDGNYAIKP
ncbi:MAG TPA: hypothetical protein DEQ38_05130 [Elusimicrobia bacterium]|nr:MAG: hypothetical protein A2089_01090 [Elusimicrobia bacterium GWD2_63_28]HCC47486.1 hypothetical protein [Elusimicrobiota bacterium]